MAMNRAKNCTNVHAIGDEELEKPTVAAKELHHLLEEKALTYLSRLQHMLAPLTRKVLGSFAGPYWEVCSTMNLLDQKIMESDLTSLPWGWDVGSMQLYCRL